MNAYQRMLRDVWQNMGTSTVYLDSVGEIANTLPRTRVDCFYLSDSTPGTALGMCNKLEQIACKFFPTDWTEGHD